MHRSFPNRCGRGPEHLAVGGGPARLKRKSRQALLRGGSLNILEGLLPTDAHGARRISGRQALFYITPTAISRLVIWFLASATTVARSNGSVGNRGDIHTLRPVLRFRASA